MRMVDLIEKKRLGREHTKEEIGFIVNGFAAGDVPDYQMSAWMMAVCFMGMSERETSALTMAMKDSGDTVDLSDLPGVKVDKHSTGGVGDTTTLVVGPLVAACGGTVAKMSGRGLGHTGGTLDKLESVPGVKTSVSIDRFKEIVKETGVCVIGQSEGLVPADQKMYALRDVTSTVQSIPLIASSVMSKKLAAGTDAIVLDVKTGSGAFMQTLAEARLLARTMVKIGALLNKKTVAIITDMNQPLGLSVGNGLEVKEAVELLSGKIEESYPLYEVCMLLASHMLMVSGLAPTEAYARERLKHALASGEGLRRLKCMIEALGGDTAYIDAPELLCQVERKLSVTLEGEGYISAMDAERIGIAAQMLGAGREKKTDPIDHAVGLVMHKRMGNRVEKGEPVATFYVNGAERLDEALAMFKSAFRLSAVKPPHAPMVYDVITN
ncbi:MAG: thymidine phosphorylase [Clostridiaceae bacterium]|nr:thymidine phosphorylase [Eubacteriales bacterium]